MPAHLAEISTAVDPGTHAVVIVDQAGWHMPPKLNIPDNITLLPLPPRSPGLNPPEPVVTHLAITRMHIDAAAAGAHAAGGSSDLIGDFRRREIRKPVIRRRLAPREYWPPAGSCRCRARSGR